MRISESELAYLGNLLLVVVGSHPPLEHPQVDPQAARFRPIPLTDANQGLTGLSGSSFEDVDAAGRPETNHVGQAHLGTIDLSVSCLTP